MQMQVGHLVKGRQAHHDGFEARRYDNDDVPGPPRASLHPSPPFFSAMTTKPVVVGPSSSDGGGDRARTGGDDETPAWFHQALARAGAPQLVNASQCVAVEIRRFDLATRALVMPWTRFASQGAAGRALQRQGLSSSTISLLCRGGKAHHDGWEVRRCRDGGGGGGDDDDGNDGRSAAARGGGGGDEEEEEEEVPAWLLGGSASSFEEQQRLRSAQATNTAGQKSGGAPSVTVEVRVWRKRRGILPRDRPVLVLQRKDPTRPAGALFVSKRTHPTPPKRPR